MGASTIECGTTHPDGHLGDCQTELPYISITAEAWRGFYELGPMFTKVRQHLGRDDMVQAGAMLSKEAAAIHVDLTNSIARAAVPGPTNTTTCHPHVASWKACYYGVDPKHFQPRGKPCKYPTLDVLGAQLRLAVLERSHHG